MAKTLRTFVALTLPHEVTAVLSRLQQSLRSGGIKMSWVRPENIHLTLKFLGDTPQADVASIAGALRQALHGLTPLALSVQGLGVFPGIKRPRVLWAGLGGDIPNLKRLAEGVDAALLPIGFKPEKRGFKAHLTLGRMRKAVDSRQLQRLMADEGEFRPMAYTARRVVFYKSDLKPNGAVYTPLDEFLLAADEGKIHPNEVHA